MNEAINDKWINVSERIKQPKEVLEVRIKLCGIPGSGCYYERDYRLYDGVRILAQKVCDYNGFIVRDKEPACGYINDKFS